MSVVPTSCAPVMVTVMGTSCASAASPVHMASGIVHVGFAVYTTRSLTSAVVCSRSSNRFCPVPAFQLNRGRSQLLG